MHVQIYLKDKPEGFLGQSGESFNVGRHNFVGFSEAMIAILQRVGQFYGIFQEADQLNEDLDKLASYCQQVRFKSETEEE
jgi:hypothetical protein